MQTLMIQGTTSDAGKTTLVAGLCRVLRRKGINVAPFKPQNMALNSAVTADGGEIGRAQALQAQAAGIVPSVDLNPILLKPNSDTGAQVIVHGRALDNMAAAAYHDYKATAMSAVLSSHQRLSECFQVCVAEGAGSPAEINLRARDIANMGFACEVKCPVIIIADIDKGGIFAHLVGTLALLSEYEQNLVKGFVINRFRGDIALLQSGLEWLEQRTAKPVLGVLPYLHGLSLDAEDAVNTESHSEQPLIKVNVLLLPHLSNHTDFDALRLNPRVELSYVRYQQAIDSCDLVIIPGSKNVLGDLAFLREQGWAEQLKRHLRYGGKVLGVCGGMQMLGKQIYDPLQLESNLGAVAGLGLADFTTTLRAQKTLQQVQAECLLTTPPCAIQGYEIHAGVSEGKALTMPFSHHQGEHGKSISDGFIAADDQVAGTYLHGLFDTPSACDAILAWASSDSQTFNAIDMAQHTEQQLERLADCCEAHLDWQQLMQIIEEHNDG